MKAAIRADAYAELGTGHIMRCLALGQGIKDKGCEVVFAVYCESDVLIDRLSREGMALYMLKEPGSLEESLKIFAKEKPDWIVLDGYHFDAGYQKAVKEAGYRLLYIDDYAHLDHYYADIILNQNYGAEKFHYNIEPSTKVLAGVRYVLMRREFRDYNNFRREIPDVALKVLLTLGGSDPENFTLQVLKAINLLTMSLYVKVVIGAGNPHYESVRQKATNSRHNVEIVQSVENMAPLMAWADLAISAGGTTIWELAFMGTPSIVGVIAANQESAVKALSNDGVIISLGWMQLKSEQEISFIVRDVIHDKAMRHALMERMIMTVDGIGTSRIVEEMTSMPLRVLFLGGAGSKSLSDWLQAQGEEVYYTEKKLDADTTARLKPDIIVSYNYRHILRKNIIDIPPRGAINLHISYLPWNRGTQPNVWSFLEDTPKGVTIHLVDEGLDTGNILLQKEIIFDEGRETLKSSYEKLHSEMQKIFKEHWQDIKAARISPRKQSGGGSLHYVRNGYFFEDIIRESGWDIPIKEFKALARQKASI